MAENVYENLRQLLDRHPTGCPPAPELTEILKILFTEEEARVALGLGFRPYSVDAVAATVDIDQRDVHKHLEALADRGLCLPRRKTVLTTMPFFRSCRGFSNFPL